MDLHASEHKARTIPWLGAGLYFGMVAVLFSAHALNPEGDVSTAPALVLTLPWSMALSLRPPHWIFSVSILALAGGINAAILYWFMSTRLKWPIKVGTLAVIGSIFLALAWFLNTAEVDNLVRIARSGPDGGIYIATDQNGLRALSEATGMRQGLVFIRKGTGARYRSRKFLLKGGRLVDPYPANSIEMLRDGAIEVERIRIVDGPNKGLEGWVHPGDLRRVLSLYAL